MRQMRTLALAALLLAPFRTSSGQQILNEGFLAIVGTFYWEQNSFRNHDYQLFRLPIIFMGVAADHDITTKLQIFPEVLHLLSYYRDNPDFLATHEVAKYSFGNVSASYNMWRWEIFHVNLGGSVGHMGFLSPDFSNTPRFSIYVAPEISIYTFLGDNFFLITSLEAPISLYSHNFVESLFLKATAELIFDPAGKVMNPGLNSTFFAVGYEFELNQMDSLEIIYHRPYLKFYYIY